MTARDILRTRIEALKISKGRTQADLNKAIGQSGSYLSEFFSGRSDITIGKLDKLALALGVEVPDLFIDREVFYGLPPRYVAAIVAFAKELELALADTRDTGTKVDLPWQTPRDTTPGVTPGGAPHAEARPLEGSPRRQKKVADIKERTRQRKTDRPSRRAR